MKETDLQEYPWHQTLSLSQVDWSIFVNNEQCMLLEGKFPMVMKAVGERLPYVGA
jgi:hypothetical protein